MLYSYLYIRGFIGKSVKCINESAYCYCKD